MDRRNALASFVELYREYAFLPETREKAVANRERPMLACFDFCSKLVVYERADLAADIDRIVLPAADRDSPYHS